MNKRPRLEGNAMNEDDLRRLIDAVRRGKPSRRRLNGVMARQALWRRTVREPTATMQLRLLAAGLFALLLPTAPSAAADAPSPAPASTTPERIPADGPRTTFAGKTFVAPSGWTLVQRDNESSSKRPKAARL